MTFAVTGANGFLGVHIIHHLLKAEYNVLAIIRPESSISEFELIKKMYEPFQLDYSLLEWHRCELFDTDGLQEVFEKADYVLHLAGTISYLQRDLPRLLEVNKEYTANVVNVALSSDVKKLLYCSSIAAISKTTDGSMVTEDREWDDEIAHSNYGYTKFLGECEVWRAAEEGLPVVIINPGIILGYGDFTKGSNKLFGNAKSGFPYYSQGVTGWVGVDDVAEISIQLCHSSIVKQRFILVSENLSYKNIADEMCSAFETKKPRIEVKGILYKLIYNIIRVKEWLGLKGMLSKETVKASVAKNYFDNSKIKRELGFNFKPMKHVITEAVLFGRS